VGAALPQILFVLSPEGQGRFQTVSIFTKNYLENEANGSVGTLLLIFGKNILAHLSPRFLFWSGDSNLRHSLATFGQLGYLEFFALMLGLPAWAWKRWRSLRPGVALAVLGILSGVIPAAMTWDSLPHALRSMGVWPFFAVLTGLLWAKLSETWPRLAVIFFIIVAGGFTIRFVPTFYHEVKDASRSWFDFELVLAAAKATSEEEWDVALKAYPNYARDAWAFHLMSIKGLTCDEARMRIEKIIGK
jgi:hypothetical protein